MAVHRTRGPQLDLARGATVLMALVLATGGYVRCQSQRSLEQRLRAEAPAAWAKYREFAWTLQGRCVHTKLSLPDRKTLEHFTAAWKRAPGRVLAMGEGDVVGQNSRYKFRLERNGEDKPWLITNVTMLTGGEPQMPIPYCFGQPSFHVDSVGVESGESGELVRLTYSMEPEDARDLSHQQGWLVLDPAHDWVIRNGEAQIRYDRTNVQIKEVFRYKYKEGSKNHLIPTEQVVTASGVDDKGKSFGYEHSMIIDCYEQENVPEKEFTLSAFGLPEPGMSQRSVPWFVWVALAGIICLSAAVVIQWRAARRRALEG